jgi:hypothetical protein
MTESQLPLPATVLPSMVLTMKQAPTTVKAIKTDNITVSSYLVSNATELRC